MKNLSDIALPSVEEIKNYHAGSLPDARSREIELLALEHPLVSDALEGYGEIPAYGGVPQKMLPPAKPLVWRVAGWFSAGVAVVVAGIFIYQGGGEEAAMADGNTPVIKKEIIASNFEPTSEVSEAVIPADQEAPVAKKKPGGNTAQAAGDTLVRSSLNATTAIRPERVSPAADREPELFNWPSSAESPDGVVLKHINNYKVVDYGEMRHNHWSPFTADLPGTPASMENGESTDPSDVTVQVPYLRFMQDCIEAYYKGETNRCLKHFATVLEQYPDDVNAQFYSAMCFYNKGDYSKAIRYYDQSLANDTRTFGEESLYYKALSLKKSGKTAEACDLFTYIRDTKGYYSKKAGDELKGCGEK